MKSSIFVVIAAIAVLFHTGTRVHAAELIMVEQAGCHWCEVWDEEIAPIYPKTASGKRAPLRRVDLHDAKPDDLAGIELGRFTPTFVLVENGKEIGRIRGYPGEDFFWGLLDQMVGELDAAASSANGQG